MSVEFPARRSDGSFSFDVILRTDAGDLNELAGKVTDWSVGWVQSNRYWKTSLYVPEETLDFFNDFSAAPTCLAAPEGALILRIECRPEAQKRWRYWLVLRLLKELVAAFPEITSVERM